jgi:RNA polymerase sigma-70 factor (ECF subfamily)
LPDSEELMTHIRGCGLNNRESQKKIFSTFYGYAMSICLRYSSHPEDASEILNDGFLKIFREINRFVPAYADAAGSFRGWLRKIMVYTAIDHNRKNHRYETNTSFKSTEMEHLFIDENVLDKISSKEIMNAIQKLSPAYRTTLNLFIVDGFSHEEIAQHLGISTGTSKSNLFKAKKQLQKILSIHHQPVLIKDGK